MTPIRLLLPTLATALLPAVAVAVPIDYVCSAQAGGTCNVPIADANDDTPSQTTASFALGAAACSGAVASVAGVSVVVQHNNVGDLTLELLPPAGAPVVLLARPALDAGAPGSCDGDDLFVRFNPTGDTPQCQAYEIPALGADVRAAGSFAALAGQSPVGTWQLRIGDAVAGGYGQVLDWTLHLECNLSPEIFSDGFE